MAMPRRYGVLNSRVVTARDKLRIDLFRIFVQLAELQPVVAAHARIGRAAGVVLGDEVVDDPAEVLLEVADVERDAEFGGYHPRIRGVVDRTAALMADPDLLW